MASAEVESVVMVVMQAMREHVVSHDYSLALALLPRRIDSHYSPTITKLGCILNILVCLKLSRLASPAFSKECEVAGQGMPP